MTMMRAVQVTKNGTPGEVLAVQTIERPEPETGEVRVKVGAASLNFNDIDRCRGKLVSVPTPPPFTLGMDVCGVVDAVGDGAEAWLGRRVVAITKTALGGIAEYAIAPAVSVFDAPASFSTTPRPPPSCSPSRPPTWPCSGGVACRPVRPWSSTRRPVAWAPPASSWARPRGPGSSPWPVGRTRVLCAPSLGADLVVDHLQEDFVEAVLAATDDAGADVVYDLAGGDFVERSWRCTARGGRYLAVGFADDDENGMTGRPLRMACIGNIDIVAVMVAWADDVDPGMRRFGFNPFGRDVADEIHADLLRLVADGSIRPSIGRRVSMEEAGAALDDHEQRRSLGRTVVEVGR